MKKFFAASLLALCLVAGSQQQASAWCNFRFGVGMNIQWQSGNNSLLWGLHQNGQVPGPEYFHADPFGGGQQPFFGGGHHGMGHGHHHHAGTAQPSPYQLMSYPGSYYPMSYPGMGYYSFGQ